MAFSSTVSGGAKLKDGLPFPHMVFVDALGLDIHEQMEEHVGGFYGSGLEKKHMLSA